MLSRTTFAARSLAVRTPVAYRYVSVRPAELARCPRGPTSWSPVEIDAGSSSLTERLLCRSVSIWANVPAGPPDPILGQSLACTCWWVPDEKSTN